MELIRHAYERLIGKRAVSIDEPDAIAKAIERWNETPSPMPATGPYEVVWLVNDSRRLVMRCDGTYSDLWERYEPGWVRVAADEISGVLKQMTLG